MGIFEFFSANKKIVEISGNIILFMNGKDPKLEKKTSLTQNSVSTSNYLNKPNSDVNNLFNKTNSNYTNSNISNINNSNISNSNISNENMLDKGNSQNINPNKTNAEKKSFGFLKKKNQNEETIANTQTSNNNQDLFTLIGDTPFNQDKNQQQIINHTLPVEKSGFSFIKSKNREIKSEKVEKNINNNPLNASDFTNNLNIDKPNKNTNYDLLNEIYNQAFNDSNLNYSNPNNVNVLTNNLQNLNFNNKNNDYSSNTDAFGKLNFNSTNNLNGNYNIFNYNNTANNRNKINSSQNENSNSEHHRKSNYIAPNFEMMFNNSPDLNNTAKGHLNESNGYQNTEIPKTNEEIDFMSELNLIRKK